MASNALPDLDTFSFQVTVHIKPEDVDAFFEACTPVFENITAEPDCLYFEIFQDPNNLGTISWVENWSKSPAWIMENQVTKDYYKPYFEATEKLYIKPREVKLLKRLAPKFSYAKPGNFA